MQEELFSFSFLESSKEVAQEYHFNVCIVPFVETLQHLHKMTNMEKRSA